MEEDPLPTQGEENSMNNNKNSVAQEPSINPSTIPREERKKKPKRPRKTVPVPQELTLPPVEEQ